MVPVDGQALQDAAEAYLAARWMPSYRDAAGIRRWVTCDTRKIAEDVLAMKLQGSRQPTRPLVDPDITLSAYAERWLGLIAATLKPRTLEGHRYVLNLHILPALGGVKVRQVHKGQIRAFLALKLESGRLPRPEKEVARGAPETREKAGEAWRIRTSDSLLKRQELYQAELTPHAMIITHL